MADTYLNYQGNLIKLVDNNDGTHSVATAGSPPAEIDTSLSSLRDAITGSGVNAKSLFNLFEILSGIQIPERIHVPEIESPASYSSRTMTLSANPGEMQQFSFGDGVTSVGFEYVSDVEDYTGVNIPILLGADEVETQANTILAYESFEGQKPLVTAEADGNKIVITATVPGAIQLTLAAPATVGIDSGLLLGEVAVDMRAIYTALSCLYERVNEASKEPIADSFEQIAIDSTAIALTTPPEGVLKALISVETADIRFRIDGTDPTSTVGQPALKDDVIVLSNAIDISKFKAIKSGSTAATLSVTYFK